MYQDEDLDDAREDEHNQNNVRDGEEYTEEFLKNVKPFQEQKKKSRRRKVIFSILFAIVLISASGYGGYKYLTREVGQSRNAQQNQTVANEPVETNPGGTFESQILKLSFDYPSGFRVDDDQVSTLNVVSEPITVKDEFSEPVEVVAVLYITEDKELLQEYKEESLTAATDSAKLIYSSPTEVQRPETSLTFISVGTSAAVESVIVTGSLEYEGGAPVPYADIEAVIPTIETRFYACGSRECDYEKAARIGIDPTEWQSNQELQQIESIISSLKIN